MNIALYFGSFNPLHVGHLTICKYIIDQPEVDQLRLIVSPNNPLKAQVSATKELERLEYVRSKIERANLGSKILVSDVEYNLSRPLYTINTLRYIRQIEPQHNYILIIGADNLKIIEQWHKWDELLIEFPVWVYPRSGYDVKSLCCKYGCRLLRAPKVEISSTQIRDAESHGLDMSQFKA